MQPFLKMWMPFLTQDINVHFCILFIAKLELFKLHSKVRSFKRMFEFNQVRLGPNVRTYHMFLIKSPIIYFPPLQCGPPALKQFDLTSWTLHFNPTTLRLIFKNLGEAFMQENSYVSYMYIAYCSARNNSRPSANFRAFIKFDRLLISLFGHMTNQNIMLRFLIVTHLKH